MIGAFDRTDGVHADILRLFYTSLAVDDLAVRDIARACEARNREAGLTGVLLRVEGTFMQVIEGEAKAVTETFERICCDFRHRDIALLEIEPAQERIFGQWSMAHVGDREDITIELRDDLADIRLLAGINAHNAVRRMRELLGKMSDQASGADRRAA